MPLPYCAQADVEHCVGGAARLVQLLDRDGDGSADAGVLDAAIAEADALINSYASKKFEVPFATTPITIKTLSARMTARILHRGRAMELKEDVGAEDRDRKWLEDLARGSVLPGVEPIPAKGEIVTDTAGTRDTSKNVSRDRLKGFW